MIVSFGALCIYLVMFACDCGFAVCVFGFSLYYIVSCVITLAVSGFGRVFGFSGCWGGGFLRCVFWWFSGVCILVVFSVLCSDLRG